MAVVQTAMLAGHALHRIARRHPDAPDHGGGPGHAVFESAVRVWRLKERPGVSHSYHVSRTPRLELEG